MWPRRRRFYSDADPGGGGTGDGGAGDGGQGTGEGGQGGGPGTGAGDPGGGNPPGGGDPGIREWMRNLPAELQADKDLRRHESLEAALTHSRKLRDELKSRPKKGAIVVPGEGATEEQRKAYNEAVGIPESADGYELQFALVSDPTNPSLIPVEAQEQTLNDARAQAHSMGLTQTQAKQFLEYLTDKYRADIEAKNVAKRENAEQNTAALQQHFGGDLQEALERHKQAMDQFGRPDESGNWLQAFLATTYFPNGVGNHPAWIRFGNNVAAATTEDGLLDGEGNPTGGDGGLDELEWDFSKSGPLQVKRGRGR